MQIKFNPFTDEFQWVEPGSGGSFSSDLLPDTDNTYNLGSATYTWKYLHLSNRIYSPGFFIVNVNSVDRFKINTAGSTLLSPDTLSDISATDGGVTVKGSGLCPTITDVTDLGGSALAWDNLYMSGDIKSDTTFAVNDSTRDRVKYTTSYTTLYSPDGLTSFQVYDGVIYSNGRIIPSSDNTFDFGDATHAWKDLYLDGSIYTNGAKVGVPAGVLMPFAGSSAPTGYLLCDGSAQSTSTYANLFAAIGYTYGGSGASFNLPQMANRHPLGVGTKALGTSGGTLDHTHTGPNHYHSGPNHYHTFSDSFSGTSGSGGSHTHSYNTVIAHAHTATTGLSGMEKPSRMVSNYSSSSYASGTNANAGLVNNTAYTYSPSASTSIGSSGSASGTTGAASPSTHTHSFSGTAGGNTGYSGTGSTGYSGTGATGSNNAPYLAVNYIIKF